jgi:DNA-binding NtrC family response regulator
MAAEMHHEPRNDRNRILVIDDSPIIRQMLVDILSDDGFVVETAEDGVKGTAMAMNGDYLVVLCDVHMPQRNGLETVRAILGVKPLTRIVMTDSFPDKLATTAREEGALCCLQKPFDVAELREVIARVKAGRAVTVER